MLLSRGTKFILSLLLTSCLLSGTVNAASPKGPLAPQKVVTGADTLTELQAQNNYFGKIQYNNSYFLKSTWTALAKMQSVSGYSPAQLTVLYSGDSTTGMHMPAIGCALRIKYGDAGFIGQANSPLWICGATGLTNNGDTGTVLEHSGSNGNYDYTRSPNGQYIELSDGVCRTYGTGGGYAVSNKYLVLYIKESGLGNMVVSTLDKGSSTWVTQATVNTSNSTLAGGAYSTTLSTALPRELKVCASGGTVKVYTIGMINTTVNGVIVAQDGRGGLRISDYAQTPTAVTYPWIEAMHPDLVTFKMDTNGSSGTYPICNYLTSSGTESKDFAHYWKIWTDSWRHDNPLRDIVIDGSYPLNDKCIEVQNEVQRQWAINNDAYYHDGFSMSGSLENELTLGWLTSSDTAHQTYIGQYAQSMQVLNELGLNSFARTDSDILREPKIRTSSILVKTDSLTQIDDNDPARLEFIANLLDVRANLYRGISFYDTQYAKEFGWLAGHGGNNYLPFIHVQSSSNPGIGKDWRGGLVVCNDESCNTHNTFGGSVGYTDGYTLATLQSMDVKVGGFAYITDAATCTFNTTPTSGGSIICPVFYNGSAWVAH